MVLGLFNVKCGSSHFNMYKCGIRHFKLIRCEFRYLPIELGRMKETSHMIILNIVANLQFRYLVKK
jgi:hypothetical protein